MRKRGQKEGYCPVAKSCNSLIYRTPGSSIYGISQARRLEWAALSFFRGGPSRPRVRTCVSYIGKWILYHWATREAPANWLKKYNFSYHREEFIRQRNRGLVFVFHPLTKSYIPLYRHWVSQLKKDALIESCANIFPSSHHVHFPCRPKLGETF